MTSRPHNLKTSKPQNMKIGVDLGGTNVRVGLVNHDQLIRKETAPCPKGTEQEVTNQILSLIDKLMTDEVTSIGIGVPSVVDREKGIVYHVANIPSWEEVHLRKIMEDAFHKPTFLNNDANCFAWGVHLFGEGRNFNDMVGLTVGTGIGSGLIINGRLYNGHNTGAGEIGSLPFKDKDFESYCASRFFQDFNSTGKQLAEEARAGNPEALDAWRLLGENMGWLIEAIIFAYDPEAIIFGGGITDAYDLFKDSMMEHLNKFPYPESVARLHIAPSNLENAALLGAAMLDS